MVNLVGQIVASKATTWKGGKKAIVLTIMHHFQKGLMPGWDVKKKIQCIVVPSDFGMDDLWDAFRKNAEYETENSYEGAFVGTYIKGTIDSVQEYTPSGTDITLHYYRFSQAFQPIEYTPKKIFFDSSCVVSYNERRKKDLKSGRKALASKVIL